MTKRSRFWLSKMQQQIVRIEGARFRAWAGTPTDFPEHFSTLRVLGQNLRNQLLRPEGRSQNSQWSIENRATIPWP